MSERKIKEIEIPPRPLYDILWDAIILDAISGDIVKPTSDYELERLFEEVERLIEYAKHEKQIAPYTAETLKIYLRECKTFIKNPPPEEALEELKDIDPCRMLVRAVEELTNHKIIETIIEKRKIA